MPPVEPRALVPSGDPLSSAALRYLVHQLPVADRPGPVRTRPFGLRGATVAPVPERPEFRYCPQQQVAVDDQGVPLVETMGKDWKSKSSSDGEEGPEEDWGWEES